MKQATIVAGLFLAFLVAALVLLSCGPRPLPPLDPSDPNATCATACQNVTEMTCSGWSSPNGAPCAAVCENAAANGVAWPVGCVSAAKSCDAANRCR